MSSAPTSPAFSPKRVEKPWGEEVWFADTPLYCGKILSIKAGMRLSRHYHAVKDEVLHLLSGRLLVELDTQSFELSAGQSLHVSPGMIHRFEAITDCVLLEASTPHPDERVRVEDDYGRAPTVAKPSKPGSP